MPTTRRTLALLALTGLAAGVLASPAGAVPQDDAAVDDWIDLVVTDGMTQPVFSVDEAIIERVWVQTKVDTDFDGKRDRVAVDINRPDGGGKVSTILTASPYYDCCRDVENHPVDVDRLPQEWIIGREAAEGTGAASDRDERARLAEATADAVRNRFLGRGYATVSAQTIGTADSDGCPTIGDNNETLSVKAVIDWLAGRGKAFDEDGDRVKAGWSTGRVGMMGVSYDGTLPQQVATTGVKGLRTIVPISAISSWYDYYRANGLVVAPGGFQGEDTDVLAEFNVAESKIATCQPTINGLELAQDRGTGDWSDFWQQRDYVRKADKIKASVFAVHGLNDWNVKTQHVEQLWDVLAENDVPRKIWWHQGAHGGPGGDTTYELPDGSTSNFGDTVNRWMDHWLYGIENGIEDEPTAIIEREDSAYYTYRNWPDPRVEDRTYRLSTMADAGALTLAEPGDAALESFVDDGRNRTAESLVQQPGSRDDNRLAYVTGRLEQATRFSGTVKVDLSMSVDNRRDANVTALLVDYGPSGSASIVTRGWIDPQNRDSLAESKPLEEGTLYDLRFGLQPDDYVFAEGHRIGLVVISTDFAYTLRPEPGTRLSLDTRASSITLPVVGG